VGGFDGVRFGFPAETRTRVLVWRIPTEDGWDLDAMSVYESEIREYLPDFSFCGADSDSVSYRFESGGESFEVDRGSYLILALDSLRLRRASAKYVMSMLHGVGL
jgi:hypothetical protein